MRNFITLMTNKVKTVALFLATLVVVSLTTSCKKEDTEDTNQSTKKDTPQVVFSPPETSITNHVEWEGELDMTKTEEGYLTLRIKIPHRKANDGKIHDLEWKKTFITKSVEYHRDVVPIFFGGRNSNRFYRIAHFSDTYLKKVNIAMLFLVDEMYKNVGKTFRVAIGKPIPWQTFDKSKTPMEWAKFVEDKVYEL